MGPGRLESADNEDQDAGPESAESDEHGTGPYPGLASYTEDNAEYFFGRERERDTVITSLSARRLTVLYGESGVGKSSLLRAGVAARLAELALAQDGPPEFIPVVFSAWRDDEPVNGLIGEIHSAAKKLRAATIPSTTPSTLDGAIQAVAGATDSHLLILLDQFEEYFFYHARESGDGTFFDEFPRAINSTEFSASFLISIREDALARLDRLRRRIPQAFDTLLRLRPLSAKAARLAITRPLDAYNSQNPGRQVTPDGDLVDEVVEHARRRRAVVARTTIGARGAADGGGAGDGEVSAPYLQLVMARLWDAELNLGSNRLRLATLNDELGGADEIVRTHLDTVLHDELLSDSERLLVADLFEYLVSPSGTKIAHTAWDLTKYTGRDPLDPRQIETTEQLLDKLGKSEARIILKVDPPSGSDADARYEIFHDVLAPAIVRWRDEQHAQRDAAEAERQRAAEADRARREVEQLERDKLAAEERARAEQKTARALRFRLWISRALLAVALGLGVVVFVVLREELASKRTGESRQLAGEALADLSRNGDVATLLSLEAYRLSPTLEARGAVVAALARPAVAVLRGHTGVVYTVAASRDGKMLASGSEDGTVRLWSVASHKQIGAPLIGHGGAVYSVAFSPDGSQLASAEYDDTIQFWRVATGHEIGQPIQLLDTPNSIAFSPNGKLLASGDGGDAVRLWSVAKHNEVGQPLEGHSDIVNGVAFSPDSKSIASASDDKTIRLWSVSKHTEIGRPLRGHTDWVHSVAFSPDGKLLVSGSYDQTVRLWSVATRGEIGAPLSGHVAAVLSVAFSSDGRTLASGSLDHTVRLWSVTTHSEIGEPLTGHASSVEEVAFVAGGALLASAGRDNTVRLWSALPAGRIARPLLGLGGTAGSLSLSADGALLAADNDKAIRVWNPATGRLVDRPLDHSPSALLSTALSPDGKLLAWGGDDEKVHLWSVPTRRPILPVLAGHTDSITTVGFSPDGKLLGSASIDKTLRLWSVPTRKPIPPALTGHTDYVSDFAFSPDGTKIATSSDDGSVRLWSVANHRQIGRHPLEEPSIYSVETVAFSPDGKTIASGGDDLTIRLWNAATRKEVGAPISTTSKVWAVAFTPDGRALASIIGCTLQIWDVATRRPLGPALPLSQDPTCGTVVTTIFGATLAFTHDGVLASTDVESGRTLLWSKLLTSGNLNELEAALCPTVGRNLSHAEWDAALPGESYHATCTGHY